MRGWLTLVSMFAIGCTASRGGLAEVRHDAGTGDAGDARDANGDAEPLEDVGVDAPEELCVEGSSRCADADVLDRCLGGTWQPYTCRDGCTFDFGTCAPIETSNGLGRLAEWAHVGSLSVGPDEIIVADTSDGRIEERRRSSLTEVVRVLREPGEGTNAGIEFGVVDGVGVFRLAEMSVDRTGELRLIGSRPAAVLASGDIRIAGILSLRPAGTVPAAGSNSGAPGDGEPGRAGMNSFDSGGGGGGNAFGGASGGNAPGSTGGGSGGASHGTSSVSPLSGGGSGGTGGGVLGGAGGYGGGAVQLSSAGEISLTGVLDAGGGGGQGGGNGSTGGGGGGGGAGGSALIEAPTIAASGVVIVSGGAGGQGTTCESACVGDASGRPGDDGSAVVPARGSPILGTGGGGGDGSDSTGEPRFGFIGTNGGGGGGGAGRVRFNTGTGSEDFRSVCPSGEIAIGVVARP